MVAHGSPCAWHVFPPPPLPLAKQRDAAIGVLTRDCRGDPTFTIRWYVPTARAIIVELPGITGSTQIADITSLLTSSGMVAILDTDQTSCQLAQTQQARPAPRLHAGQYQVAFTGDQIDRNQVAAQRDNQSGQWIVQFAFAGSVRQQFASYTASHIGEYLTITVDDVVVESATIQSEIDGAGQISGVNEAEARQMAAYLNSGSLPAMITVVSSEQVTPSAA